MRKWRPSREVLVLTSVAVAATVAGAAAMYGFLELERSTSPEPLSGSFSDVTTGHAPLQCTYYPCWLFFLNASVTLTTPSSLDPQQVEVIVSGLNGSLVAPCGTNVNSWTLHYDPSTYPHWLIQTNDCSSNSLAAAFVDPNGGVVGTFNTSQPSASSINSGATMMLSVALDRSSLSGVDVALSYTGHAGILELSLG